MGGIIAAGIIPAGLEMMDGPAVAAVEDQKAGYPLDAEALLCVRSMVPGKRWRKSYRALSRF